MLREAFEFEKHRSMRQHFFEQLPKLGEKKTFVKGAAIDRDLYEGYCKFILKGMMRISVLSRDGNEKLFFLMRSGEMFDEYPGYGICDLEITVPEETEMIFFRFDDVKDRLENPQMCMEYLLYSMKRKQTILMMQASSQHFDDIIGRIASLIIRTAYQCGSYSGDHSECKIDYCFTHEEIASFVGCSRVTVTRHLKELTTAGVIKIVNRHIIIKNMEGLSRYTNIH